MTYLEDIKKSLDSKRLIIGKDKTIKNIKLGNVLKIYVSSNCPDNAQEDIKRYSKINKFEFKVLNKSNEELGVICKKPFSISVLSILSESK